MSLQWGLNVSVENYFKNNSLQSNELQLLQLINLMLPSPAAPSSILSLLHIIYCSGLFLCLVLILQKGIFGEIFKFPW